MVKKAANRSLVVGALVLVLISTALALRSWRSPDPSGIGAEPAMTSRAATAGLPHEVPGPATHREDANPPCSVQFLDAVTGLPIQVSVAPATEARQVLRSMVIAESGLDGLLALPAPPEPATYVSLAPQHVPQEFVIDPNKRDRSVVRLRPGACLSVACLDPEGAPVAGVKVMASKVALPATIPSSEDCLVGAGPGALHSALSDALGVARFTSLGSGSYVLGAVSGSDLAMVASPVDGLVVVDATMTARAEVRVLPLVGYRLRLLDGECTAVRLCDESARFARAAGCMQAVVERQHALQRLWTPDSVADAWIADSKQPSSTSIELLVAGYGWWKTDVVVHRLAEAMEQELHLPAPLPDARGTWVTFDGDVVWPIRLWSEPLKRVVFAQKAVRLWLPDGKYRVEDYYANQVEREVDIGAGAPSTLECSYKDQAAIDVRITTPDGERPGWCCVWVERSGRHDRDGQPMWKPVSANKGRAVVLVPRGKSIDMRAAMLGGRETRVTVVPKAAVEEVDLRVSW